MRKRTLLLAATLTTGLLTALPVTTASAAPSGLVGDFNGDGYRDFAAPASNATVGGEEAAGAVGIAYGSSSGIGRRTSVSQNTSGVPGGAEIYDYFGDAAAVGDLNNDGYSDLAIGTPYEQVGSDVAGGTVVIVWGSSTGLKGATTVSDPAPAKHDRWGQALAVGDFTGDGKADLAVGATGTTQWIIKGGFTKAGSTGAKLTYTTAWTGSAGVLRLTAGKVNKDTKADLVLGGHTKIASETVLDHNYLYFGTTSAPSKKTELPYGRQLAVGDVNKDGYGDIVTGETETATGGDLEAPGAAVISYGTSSGVGTKASLTGSGRPSLGDINGDGYPDLALGYPEESSITTVNGAVLVHYGSATGLTAPVTLTQDTAGVPGAAEYNDFFGTSVLLTDVTGDGRADLVVGADGENSGDGLITFLKGATTGITTSGATSYGPSGFAISTAGSPTLGTTLVG
ncbi:FG-GAP and VCBS repeat-containing protein [Streptomyces sp. W16]|uniref:FG-GAP and VCBS repeat-containing protein n=1 Tax=Streptomyces sp. W16 TaxID=3076631 RepID=UPI00295AFF71|nr:FG-GAP and VCBS repeat-containing protein [Streptomyces sp. W16]MDV9177166.1 FG-GAP and VCBS repeat-containing protein [Streptomyces sp. W16]